MLYKKQNVAYSLKMAKRANYFKLLLIITMVIQPVTFSYAMASMDLSHDLSSLAPGHDGDHAMNENMVDTHDQNVHQEGGSGFDNCCYTAVCSPASMVNATTVPHVPNSQYIVSIAPALKSIDLPTEIKPPRSLLG